MRHPIQSRLWVSLLAAGLALAGWKFLPGSEADRLLIHTVAQSFGISPTFISGAGSNENPWNVGSLEPQAHEVKPPFIVSLGDDSENVFQSSPPSPIDVALVFRNFQRLGVKHAASAAVLSWESPDPISLTALESKMAAFESLLTAAPLSRGAVPMPLPPSFRRASLPLSTVHGNTSTLPMVNRIPIPNVILSGVNGWSGFTRLESEEAGQAPFLIARWEDRVVFAFPLLAVLQRMGTPVEEMEIRAGEYLKLGKNGPILPMDSYGRMTSSARTLLEPMVIPAETVIDGQAGLFSKSENLPVILRDDQSIAETGTREFSRNLSSLITTMVSSPGARGMKHYDRFPPQWELVILGCGCWLIFLLTRLKGFSRNWGFISLAATTICCQWFGAGLSHLWLPGLPLLAGTGGGFLASLLLSAPPKPQIAQPVTAQEPEKEPPAAVALVPPPKPKRVTKEKTAAPAKKTVKKAAAKKTPAKKATAKKTAAKKAARSKKQPPSDS